MLEVRIKIGHCITVVSGATYILVFTEELIITVRHINAPLILEFQRLLPVFQNKSSQYFQVLDINDRGRYSPVQKNWNFFENISAVSHLYYGPITKDARNLAYQNAVKIK